MLAAASTSEYKIRRPCSESSSSKGSSFSEYVGNAEKPQYPAHNHLSTCLHPISSHNLAKSGAPSLAHFCLEMCAGPVVYPAAQAWPMGSARTLCTLPRYIVLVGSEGCRTVGCSAFRMWIRIPATSKPFEENSIFVYGSYPKATKPALILEPEAFGWRCTANHAMSPFLGDLWLLFSCPFETSWDKDNPRSISRREELPCRFGRQCLRKFDIDLCQHHMPLPWPGVKPTWSRWFPRPWASVHAIASPTTAQRKAQSRSPSNRSLRWMLRLFAFSTGLTFFSIPWPVHWFPVLFQAVDLHPDWRVEGSLVSTAVLKLSDQEPSDAISPPRRHV